MSSTNFGNSSPGLTLAEVVNAPGRDKTAEFVAAGQTEDVKWRKLLAAM